MTLAYKPKLGTELEFIGPLADIGRRRIQVVQFDAWYEDAYRPDAPVILMGKNGRPRGLITLPGGISERRRATFPRRPESSVAFVFICRSGPEARCMAKNVRALCPRCGAEFDLFGPSGKYRRQYCSRVCGRAARLGTEPRTPWQERFWRFVPDPRPVACWEWAGERDKKGYGVLMIDPAPPQRYRQAPRASWEIHNEPIPPGKVICHRCDNPPCVNPAHLFIGTQQDNIADMIAKGRQRTPVRYSREVIDQIHALRAEGLLQREISERLGVSTTQIGNVLNGQSRTTR